MHNLYCNYSNNNTRELLINSNKVCSQLPLCLGTMGLAGSKASSDLLQWCSWASIVLMVSRTKNWTIPEAGLVLYWYCEYNAQLSTSEVKHLWSTGEGSSTDFIQDDQECHEPWLSGVGLQVPQGVVWGLVVTGITLGGWAVLEQHHGHSQDHVAQFEISI